MAELRRVINEGDDNWIDAYNGDHYVIAPGAEALVPQEAVNLWLGDNSIRNTPNRSRRREELMRLRTRYGADVVEMDARINGEPIPNGWDQVVPRLRVETIDGKVLETVVSDPEGTKVHEAEITVDEQQRLHDLIMQQQEDLKILRENYKRLAREREATTSSDATEDTPEPVASRKARAATTRAVRAAVEEDAPVA